eukprot:12379272-Alexandrium_andersonii.AAC.1
MAWQRYARLCSKRKAEHIALLAVARARPLATCPSHGAIMTMIVFSNARFRCGRASKFRRSEHPKLIEY